MFLWISGFLAGENEDDSLKYSQTVKPEFERAVMGVLGWSDFNQAPEGEWLLMLEQIKQISLITNEALPTGLDIFIGVTNGQPSHE